MSGKKPTTEPVPPVSMNKELQEFLRSPIPQTIAEMDADSEIDKLIAGSPYAKAIELRLQHKLQHCPPKSSIRPKPLYPTYQTPTSRIFQRLKLNGSASAISATPSPVSQPSRSPERSSRSPQSPVQALAPLFMDSGPQTSSKAPTKDNILSSDRQELSADKENASSVPESSADDEEVVVRKKSPVKKSKLTKLRKRKVDSCSPNGVASDHDFFERSDSEATKALPPEVVSPQKAAAGAKRATGAVNAAGDAAVSAASDAGGSLGAAEVDDPAVEKSTSNKESEEEATKPLVKETVLEDWVIQVYQQGVRVEGHRVGDPQDQFWHSSKILRALTSTLLETASGSVYQLCGRIATDVMEDQDSLLLPLFDQFKSGFPPNWEQLIQKVLDEQKEKQTSRRKSARVSYPQFAKPAKIPKSKSTHNTPISRPQPKKKKMSQSASKSVKHNNSFLANVKEAGTKEDPLIIDKLPRSRSGRPIIPQLAWWTNQRLVVHPGTNSPEVIQGTPSRIIGPEVLSFKEDERLKRRIKTEVMMKQSRKSQKSPRAVTNGNRTSASDRNTNKSSPKTVKATTTESDAASKADKSPKEKSVQSSSQKSHEDSLLNLDDSNTPESVEALTDEEIAYSQTLQETLERLESRESSFEEADKVVSPEGPNIWSASDNVDLIDLDLQTEVQSIISKTKSQRERRKAELKSSTRLLDYQSPHIHLKNVLDIKKNTPELLLKKALSNLPTSERKKMTRQRARSAQPPLQAAPVQTSRRTTSVKSQRLKDKQAKECPEKKEQDSVHKPRTRSSSRNKQTPREPSPAKSKPRPKQSKAKTSTKPKPKRSKQKKRISAPQPAEDDILLTDLSSEEDLNLQEDRGRSKNRRQSSTKQQSTGVSASHKSSRSVSASHKLSTSVSVSHKSSTQRGKPSRTPEVDVQRCEANTAGENGEMEGEGRPWTDDEVTRYKIAAKDLPKYAAWYWDALAASVGTRTPQECRDYQHHGTTAAPGDDTVTAATGRKAKKAKQTTVTEPSQVTGGRGTLKRKRQLRELIEHHETAGPAADMFGSTPFKGMKGIKLSTHTASRLPAFRTPGTYCTPGTKTPQSKRQKTTAYETPRFMPLALPASMTPLQALNTPHAGRDSNDLDLYEYRMKKGKGQRQWGVLSQKTSGISATKTQQEAFTNVADDMPSDMFVPSKKIDYGDSDEDDYYFSDVETNQ